jgi:glycosyltransferase involved in cell wall biosynthesis
MTHFDSRRRRYIWSIMKRGPTEVGYSYFRARRRRRNLADNAGLDDGDRLAMSGYFDVDPEGLERTREIVTAYEELDQLEIRTIQWFVPYFEHPYFAGVHTVLRFAEAFARDHGVVNRFCIYDAGDAGGARRVAKLIATAFPALADSEVTQWSNAGGNGARGAAFDHLEACDAAIATFWTSAYPLLTFNRCRAKFFFIQDYEPMFHPAGSASALAEITWRIGLPGIVNTPGLADVYRAYGNSAIAFRPAVDLERFHPPLQRARGPEDPVRIVFYGRPSVPRNAFGLGVAALSLVKERYGDRVEIVSAGERFQEGQYGLEGKIRNVGVLPDLDAVADFYRSCDIGLVFMLTKHPSYQPIEFMASGVATVSNANPATTWLLKDEQNALVVEPAPSLVADAIGRLIEDEALRTRLTTTAAAEVAQVAWSEQFDLVWGAMTKTGEPFTAGDLDALSGAVV